ncbi:class I SAM-dependent methyltransferase [Rubinisphaera margarita]|uniref:class I SAM-dependent methyltransferase n=1 Tax=Rubinisphaera margarita TaxID=2909586 RepID=UPI001EE9AD10|nr:class I SAM-dependent methyltransferase [Rubinisphaera margarita]MCG6158175.1 class I SAM-dependent methyltransferase [Rubinisphaera margarita]
MDIRDHNRNAWNRLVAVKNRWTQPVSAAIIDRARRGLFEILLTPTRPVPEHWFPNLRETPTLCLAGAGGQQAPVLAAAGATVTVLDNSPGQLAQDRYVAEREGLRLELVVGDMSDLSNFADESFELIVHPCANAFVPNVKPVWRECFRVLRAGGVIMAGFTNPVRYIFDDERKENGNLEVRYSLPYSDIHSLPSSELKRLIDAEIPLEHGHTLEDQIGGQLEAGFVMNGFYEDKYPETEGDPLSQFMLTFIATRCVKPHDQNR